MGWAPARRGTAVPSLPRATTTSSSRPASLKRIAKLFSPYRARMSLLLSLIVLGSILGVASPFLTREAINKGLIGHDYELLVWVVLGMIALAVINAVIGVAQTWISNEVGQHVMHDLRAAVYEHLQRMSLAFFTRTRSGEVQARIAYDIGGIDDVVTSTATSTVSTVATVLATVTAMFALSWELTIFSLILLPFFVWLTRRVGNERKRIQSVRQSRLADMSTLVEESLSVSGILLAKTMGRSKELVDRFRNESDELADLEVHARMAGRWRMATVQMSFAIMPAAVYWFAGFTNVKTATLRSRSGPWWPSRSCRRGCCSRCSRCCRWASKCRPRWRCSGGSSSTSTCRSTSSRAPTRKRSPTYAATSAWTTSGSATAPRRRGR